MKQRMLRIFYGLCCLLCVVAFSSPVWAQQQNNISIQVSLDHADWIYKTGQKAQFSFAVLRAGKPLENQPVHYEIGEEKMPVTIAKDIVLKNKPVIIDGGTLSKPGFLRCVVTAMIDGKKYRGLATAAYSPDSIKPVATTPADFDSFWSNARNEASKVPMNSKMELLSERCTDKINVYQVSVQNNRGGSKIYGILCVPKKTGKYPAALKVPGAGVRAYRGDTVLAEKGIITFEIGIHGVPVTMPDQFYYDLAFGPLYNYFFSNLDNRDNYYYKRVYLGCMRAVDFLVSLPQVDSSRLAVYGGSQGGALSIVTAALDKRIKYVAASYPALSDLTGYLHHRAGGWPHMFNAENFPAMGSLEKIKTSAYYDVVNFAKRITIPGLYCWGFNDEVCPPTSMYASYNSILAPKEIFIDKESGHWQTAAEAAKINAWLLEKLHASL